jgi:hypothetical protein
MIIFFSTQPASVDGKINALIERAKTLYNSDYYDIENEKWLADKLTIESLFPSWIVKAAEDNSEVLVTKIVKNYMRWLLSLEHGYGAQLDWEKIRTIPLANEIFLEAYIDFYFPGADFSQQNFSSLIPNVRKFAINADANYFNVKGTPQAIKYLISNLLGIPWDSVVVGTSTSGIITIKVDSAYYDSILNYKNFLETYVVPAGVSVIYTTLY